MNLAENLLDSLATADYSESLDSTKKEEHIVIDNSRRIIVPNSLKMIGVQLDKNVETREFDCPRYWDDGIDIYGMAFYINYVLPNGEVGTYLPYNKRLDEENSNIIHFSWKIEDYFGVYKGNLRFAIVAKKTNANGILEKRWSSLLNSDLYVAEGIESEFQITTPEQEDVITQILQKIDGGTSLVLVSSEAEMMAILENATADSTKKAYLYTGESGIYEKGAIYLLESDGTTEDNTPEQPDEPVTPTINFTIGGYDYTAEEGMTWYRWCKSGYNNGYDCAAETNTEYVYTNDGTGVVAVVDGAKVTGVDTIWDEEAYEVQAVETPETPKITFRIYNTQNPGSPETYTVESGTTWAEWVPTTNGNYTISSHTGTERVYIIRGGLCPLNTKPDTDSPIYPTTEIYGGNFYYTRST